MAESSTSLLQFRQDLEAQFRRHIREALEVSLTEEITAALGSDRHERTDARRRCRSLRKPPTVLHPPEDLLDELPLLLAEGMARVARRPPIKGAVRFLRDMGRNRLAPEGVDQRGDIEILV